MDEEQCIAPLAAALEGGTLPFTVARDGREREAILVRRGGAVRWLN